MLPWHHQRWCAQPCRVERLVSPSVSSTSRLCSGQQRSLRASFGARPCLRHKPACWPARPALFAAPRGHRAVLVHCTTPGCVGVLHGGGNTTGQSARPYRLARPRGYRDACLQNPLKLEFAVELRLGKKSTGQLEDLIGPAQFLDFALQAPSHAAPLR